MSTLFFEFFFFLGDSKKEVKNLVYIAKLNIKIYKFINRYL